MTKVNLKDATKELALDTARILSEATAAKKTADDLVSRLRAIRSNFAQKHEEEEAARKREEQNKVRSGQSRAYIAESGFVSNDEEPTVIEIAERPAEAQEPEQAAPAARTEQPAQEQPAAPAEEAPKPAEKQPEAEQPVQAQPVQEEPKPAAPAAQEKPAEQPRPPVQEERKPEPVRPAAKPVPEKKPEPPKRPAIGQIISRPGEVTTQRPVGPAANVVRMPRPNQPPRPVQGQQGPYGRPAGQQGPYGRPAGSPQGPYGRPAGQQGPYGRPAGGPQGPYGRPAGGQQGGFGRPAGGPPQAGRPAPGGAPRPGGFAGGQRPAGAGRSMGGRSRGPELVPTVEKERVSNYDPNKKNYQRQHDPEHVARNRKQEARANNYGNGGYDDDVIRGGKRARRKVSVQQTMAPIKIETAYMSGDTIIVRDLTERIGKTAGEIIKKLMILGNMATINSEIDFDTASLVAAEFGVTLERKIERTAETQLTEENVEDTDENLIARPPVVTIMGHVDHGKTSLLDYIRKSRVTAGEAGGITQHIGAYTVEVNGRQITFLDTPGHEAFTAMRMRGAQATDIAVLVVAADDSVMPQTVEAINHAKAAGVPLIVAINKMDKPAANPERVKQDLTSYDLVCEEWGGDTIMVPVSAVTGKGVDELLEMILLQADTMELRANPNRLGRGVIIEAKLDKARGPLATVLIQNGTLHAGDNIIAGMAAGRVRALINDRGERVKEAGPSTPVEIMGFDEVPDAGDELIAVGDDHLSRQVADERREKLRASREATSKVSMENLFSTLEAGKVTTLNLIIKADVQGSVQAVKQAMEKLSNDEVKVRVLHAAAGAITKDDVNLASAFNAIIIGFNIRPDASARAQAEKEKVDVRLYTVIYKAIEDMELAMKGLLAPEYREVLLGHAEVRNVFKITGAGIIAGCYVTDGKVQRNAQVRLLRDNVVVHEGKLSSLRHLKDDVREMAAGYECGMSLEGHNDIKIGDVVECFIMEEIPR
ncbi:MAG: translation initiation factor IF-2 [Clostridia bacterium]|nr:translation initiation factor IF-2 [Clostridia bacterium]